MKRSEKRPNYLLIIVILIVAQAGIFLIARSEKAESSFEPTLAEAVPIELAGWHGQSRELDQITLEMLNPEAYVVRNYTNENGLPINLTVIYGRKRTSIHSPAVCLVGAGWATIEKEPVEIELLDSGEAPLRMTRMLLQKEHEKTVVYYSFLSEGNSTGNWSEFQGRMLVARLSGREARGALLRFIVPVRGDPSAVDEESLKFIRMVYPVIRKGLTLESPGS